MGWDMEWNRDGIGEKNRMENELGVNMGRGMRAGTTRCVVSGEGMEDVMTSSSRWNVRWDRKRNGRQDDTGDRQRRWHSMRQNGIGLTCWQETLILLSQLTGIPKYKNAKLVLLNN